MDIKIKNRDGVKLLTNGKFCDEDINVMLDESLIPSGTLDVTENGEHNVTSYEKVNVNVVSTSKFLEMVAKTVTTLTEEDMEGVTSIGGYSFFRATTLESIFIPEGVKTLGESAFGYCTALHTMYLPSTINMSRHNVFQYASSTLQNIYFNGTIYQWCNIAFSNEFSTPVYHSKKLYIKNTNTNDYELLTDLIIPANVSTVGGYAWAYNEALTSVTFEAGTTKTLNAFAFYKCYGLTSVTLQEGLTTLNRYAFAQCTALTEITIPSSVTKIEGASLAIGTSTNKATIKMLGSTPPTLGSSGIDSTTIEKIEIPSGSLSAYSSATNWSALTSLFVEI